VVNSERENQQYIHKMNIPNLPTDNLYKFAAIFGLVLIVFSSYMFNKTVDNGLKIEDEIRLKHEILRLDSIQTPIADTIQMAKAKAEFDKENNQYRRIVNSITSIFYLYVILFIIGCIAAFLGFKYWYKKTQKMNDEILANEASKIKHDKAVLVHKIQFEKEFMVYRDLWPELIKLRNATHQLRPMVEYRDIDKSEEEIRIEKGTEFNDRYKKSVVVFEENKPFYPEEIFNEVDKIINLSKKEAIQWQHMPPRDSDYYTSAQKNMDEIIETIDMVCLQIRDRIGLLKIKN